MTIIKAILRNISIKKEQRSKRKRAMGRGEKRGARIQKVNKMGKEQERVEIKEGYV